MFFRTPGGPNTVSTLSANSDGTDRTSQGTLYIPQRKLEVSEDQFGDINLLTVLTGIITDNTLHTMNCIMDKTCFGKTAILEQP